jgi:hypothetical protein
MRFSEQFISFINFSIALLCLLIGIFLIFICSFEQFYNLFFLYLKSSLKIISTIVFSMGIFLFMALRFQEGKKTIRFKSKISIYEIDRKILQSKLIEYFHTRKKLSHLTPNIKITNRQQIEINIQSTTTLKKQDFDEWERDLKKMFSEMGYKDSFYINYSQAI